MLVTSAPVSCRLAVLNRSPYGVFFPASQLIAGSSKAIYLSALWTTTNFLPWNFWRERVFSVKYFDFFSVPLTFRTDDFLAHGSRSVSRTAAADRSKMERVNQNITSLVASGIGTG